MRTHDYALRLQSDALVDDDGTVNFAGCEPTIFVRGHEAEDGYAVDSEELRRFFYPRARNFLREIANNGEFWPAMRKARPEWFEEK